MHIRRFSCFIPTVIWVATSVYSAHASDSAHFDGLWVETGRSCQEATQNVSKNEYGYHIDSDDPITIVIYNGKFYGLENMCSIVSSKRSHDAIVSVVECDGEGAKSKSFIRMKLNNTNKLFYQSTFEYARCALP